MAINYQITLEYYRLLGLRPGAGMADIKQAYREKAKKYHPDLNPSPDAQERFIEINEAYEYFVREHSIPHPRNVRDGVSTADMDAIIRQWVERERAKARARAERYARQRYEDFRKSPLYRTSSLLSMGADYLTLGFGLMTLLGPGYGLFHLHKTHNMVTGTGIFAAIMTSILGIIIIAFSLSDIRRRRKDLRNLKN